MRRAQGHQHGVLTVDGVAHQAAVEDVAGHHADAAGEVAELLRGADQPSHRVASLQRAPRQQPTGAAGRSNDEHVHERMVPGAAAMSHAACDSLLLEVQSGGDVDPGDFAGSERAGAADAAPAL